MKKETTRVLLIEDDEDDYVLIRKWLMEGLHSKYRIQWANSYEASLLAIGRGDYDVCLLDYRLGEHNGVDLLHQILDSGCKAPVIFLTGHGDYKVDIEVMNVGAADYLDKSQINSDLLDRSIRYAIEQKRVREELRAYVVRLEESNEELSQTLEELQMIGEQLRHQNEELIRARESVEVERQRFIDLFEYAPDGYVVTDKDGVIKEANRAASSLLGISQENVVGKPLALFVTDEDMDSFRAQLDRFKQLKGLSNWEVRLKPWGMAAIFAEVSVTSILPRSGEGISLRWAIRDISERKHAEKSLRDSEGELRLLSSKLLSAQEEERKRLSRELHDSIGSSLSAIKFSLENTRRQMERGEATAESITKLISIAQQAIDESRRIMTDLRPSILDDLGIIATIHWICRQCQNVYSTVCIEEEIGLEEVDVPESLKIVIFRILQESLNNICKYSQAELVQCSLVKRDESIELTVEDNGIGFDLNTAVLEENGKKGFGLTSMKERAELSGGCFAIESVLGRGTTIRASWPCRKEASDEYSGSL